MSERETPTAISTQMANQTFGRYNALYAPTGADKARVFQVNSIIDFDPQDPEVYADGLKKVREGISHALVRMDIDFTNACNNDCPPCFARWLREKYPVEIPYEKGIRLLADLKHLGCDCVRFTGGGDPLMHPNFVDLVKYSGANLRTVVDTNGDYLCMPGYSEAIAQSAHRIRFSVDSGDNETRVLSHRPKDQNYTYDQLIRNMTRLRRLADILQERDSRLLIGASFIYGPHNYHAVGKFLSDMRDIGTDWVQVKPALIRGKHPDAQGMEESVLEQIEQERAKNPDEIRMHLPERVSFDPKTEFPRCWTTQLRGFLLAHSLLSICNLVRNQEVPFAQIGTVGDGEQPIQDLLFSEQGKHQIGIVQSTAPSGCKYCIDKITQITLQNMADTLTGNPDAQFQRARVTEGECNQVGAEDNHVLNITLNPKSYQSFHSWELVEF